MKMTRSIAVVLVLVFAAFTVNLKAQTLDDVANKYNAAAELVNSDAAQAVTLLEEAIAMAALVGTDADELKMMAQAQLPAVYFRWGADEQRAGNNEKAIEVFEQTIEKANELNDANTVSRTENILGRLYLSLGNNAYRANENEKAVELLSNSLKYDPNNARTHLLKGLTYRRLENMEGMIAAMDLAIENAIAGNDAQTQGQAEKSVRDYLAVRANRSIQGNRGSEALEFLNIAVKYGEEAQTYFLLTLAYNSLSQWDNAIEAGNRALELEVDEAGEKAKIWFEIGNAQREKGNTDAACTAFRSAAHGPYTESANYQVQHVLKCN
jgi:tetratricopeptide (TPR) repeat protein